MEKRGYKLQEFVAHSANVNCLKIGKKTHRNFLTGGDDEKVNLWSIGQPTATTSLSGHTSPIESVAFDSTEVLVAAGASSGAIKLWDLEETKVVHTLNGHRSYCTAVEFHPFGEFFASGSMDTNLKIWDFRKKGCIHTYKGHRRAVSTIRFSPDGRWVVSGGLDNVVKIWDLTAGKLLHEFKFHEGHIRSMAFHPLEFLLATGSSDKTVKFWDLETFELIGSTRPEATGVRSVTFHPDGRTIFCGLDSSLKVYSWEPVICHDTLDMGWSTLGDLCIDDGKLLGCSYYHNSVAIWVADTTHIQQHSHKILAEENTCVEPKSNLQEGLTERFRSSRRSTMSPDDDTKDIKNIYVDSMTPVASRKVGSLPPVANLSNPKEVDDLASRKQVAPVKIIGQPNSNSFFTMPAIVPRDNSAKESAKSRTELSANEQDVTAVSLKPLHRRRPSATKLDIEGLSTTVESGLKSGTDTATATNFLRRLSAEAPAKESSKEKAPTSTCVTKEFQKPPSPNTRLQENRDLSVDSNKDVKPVKYVNGVAVQHGRTRSLVERFEKREKLNTDECQTPDLTAAISTNADKQTLNVVPCAISEVKTSPVRVKTPDAVPFEELKAKVSRMQVKIPEVVPCAEPEDETSQMSVKAPDVVPCAEPEAKTSQMYVRAPDVVPCAEPEVKTSQMSAKAPDVVPCAEPEAKTSQMSVKAPDMVTCSVPEAKTFTVPEKRPDVVYSAATEAKSSPVRQKPESGPNIKSEEVRSSPVSAVQRPRTAPSVLPEKGKASPMQRSTSSRRVMPERVRSSPMMVARRSSASPRMVPERTKASPVLVSPRHDTLNRMMREKAKSSPLLDDSPQTTGRGLTSNKDDDLAEDLLINHDVFLSSLRSRLTKLQVVRHFWEKNDAMGAINALRKLPDHAVQADVVSVLMERMDSFTLDLFSCLLPVLLNLLDSSTERHVSVSLELLLKLVAVFGPVVSSTISAPPTVGVDLHAEKRLESCNQCHIQLQKIHKCLPAIIRRGGLQARCAQELNIILQKP